MTTTTPKTTLKDAVIEMLSEKLATDAILSGQHLQTISVNYDKNKAPLQVNERVINDIVTFYRKLFLKHETVKPVEHHAELDCERNAKHCKDATPIQVV